MNKKTHNCSQNTSVMFRPKLGQEYTGTFLTSEKKTFTFYPTEHWRHIWIWDSLCLKMIAGMIFNY